MHELYVDSVRKSFGNTQLLTDVFISCRPGEVIGMLGRNGCGKSSLLKIIFGSLRSENKFIRVDGNVIHEFSGNKGCISFLPQHNFLPTHLSIQKIIDLYRHVAEIEILKNSPYIAPHRNKKSKELSGGERRIIELLLILYSKATYILIDEPFNGVEPIYKEDIRKIIEHRALVKGLIVTDHDYDNILAIATKVILLYNGRTRAIKAREELVTYGYLPKME